MKYIVHDMLFCRFFFFKQKPAYEMRISDWSSDVCSSDLVAAAADGRLLAFRYTDTIDMGAYARPVGGRVAMLAAEAMPGPYRWDAFEGRTIAHASNKTPAGTMRGPSGFEVNFIRERALDLIARRLDMDPAELRLRNLIPRDEMPYEVDYGPAMESLTLDTGDYPKMFFEALETLAYEPLRQEVQRRQDSGEIVGLGIGAFLDHSGLGKSETALIRSEERSVGKECVSECRS